MSDATGEVVFNWLHLTDLHVGMEGFKYLWPNYKEEFYDDLKALLEATQMDSLDLVLFTGDFVQKGDPEEFKRVDEILKSLWETFQDMRCQPKLVAVPGNHDLARPKEYDPTTSDLMNSWLNNGDFRERFWSNSNSPHRKLVKKVFKNYEEWWEKTTLPKLEDCQTGELPGDFSVTVEKDGVKLGIVGLNSTFLQLTGGDLTGKLDLDHRQFHKVCGDDGAQWVKEHATCLLLTHHPPEWLTKHSGREWRDVESEIHSPTERFALHLFGHMHEAKRLSNFLPVNFRGIKRQRVRTTSPPIAR